MTLYARNNLKLSFGAQFYCVLMNFAPYNNSYWNIKDWFFYELNLIGLHGEASRDFIKVIQVLGKTFLRNRLQETIKKMSTSFWF